MFFLSLSLLHIISVECFNFHVILNHCVMLLGAFFPCCLDYFFSRLCRSNSAFVCQSRIFAMALKCDSKEQNLFRDFPFLNIFLYFPLLVFSFLIIARLTCLFRHRFFHWVILLACLSGSRSTIKQRECQNKISIWSHFFCPSLPVVMDRLQTSCVFWLWVTTFSVASFNVCSSPVVWCIHFLICFFERLRVFSAVLCQVEG